jgi:hypothetical protein
VTVLRCCSWSNTNIMQQTLCWLLLLLLLLLNH